MVGVVFCVFVRFGIILVVVLVVIVGVVMVFFGSGVVRLKCVDEG